MARKAKLNEKYISERKTKAGTTYFAINIPLKEKDGKMFSKSVSTKDYAGNRASALIEAKRIRDEALMNIRIGYTLKSRDSVKALYDESYELIPLSLETKRKYDLLYKEYISEYGNMPISEVKAEQIQKSLNQCAKKTTHEWVARLLTVWRRIYKTAGKKQILVFNQTELVEVPRNAVFKPQRKKEISDSDYDIFMNELLKYGQNEQEKYRSRAIFYANTVMRYTGLRPQEVYSLSRHDIDMITNEISVTKSLSSDGNVKQTKTRSSVRTIPISKTLKPIMTEILKWSKYEYLFQDYYGRFITVKDRATLIGHVTKKCKKYFAEYMSRHRFSTELIKAGVALQDLRDLMGHSSVNMSVYYALSNDESRRQAVEKLN